MENLTLPYFVLLGLSALIIAEAAVVKTKPEPLHTNEENTEDNMAFPSQTMPVEIFGEPKLSEEDIIALVELDSQNQPIYLNADEKAPLDTSDFLIWKNYDPKSPQLSAMSMKAAAELQRKFFDQYFAFLTSLQNLLQISSEVRVADADRLKRLFASQRTLSQIDDQEGHNGGVAAKKVLKCYESHGFDVDVVECSGSCEWYSSQGFSNQYVNNCKPKWNCSWKPGKIAIVIGEIPGIDCYVIQPTRYD